MSDITKQEGEMLLESLAKDRARQTGESVPVAFSKVLDTEVGRHYAEKLRRAEMDSPVQKSLTEKQRALLEDALLDGARRMFPGVPESLAVAKYVQTDEGQRLWKAYDEAAAGHKPIPRRI